MASPSEAEIQTQISDLVAIYEHLRTAGGTATPNLLGLIDTYEQAMEGDFLSEAEGGLAAMRAAYAACIESLLAALTPQIRSYGRQRGFPETDPSAIVARLYQDFIDRGLRVTSRVFSFGSPTFVTAAVGSGVINRLNTDANGLVIEAQTPDSKIAKCVADEHSGAQEHEEVFEFRGTTAERDLIKIVGSGRTGLIRALSARDSLPVIGNPSFEVGTSGSSVTDWTFDTGAASGTSLDGTYFYRDFSGLTTPYALKIGANTKISQNFNNRRAQLNPGVPLYAQIAYNRSQYSGDGTLALTVGSSTVSVVLSAQSGWNILRIAIGTGNWFQNFNKEDPKVIVELSGRSTGSVLVDDIVVAPFSPFDGSWYAIVGGATPFLRDDKATWSDTETGAKIQSMIWRAYGLYLPATTGSSITWADPS